MTYSIVFVSRTGNTRQIAEAIRNGMPEGQCVYFGSPAVQALDADLILCGFWTDKATCPPEMQQFLSQLSGKYVALFGTAGFGGTTEYYQKIFSSTDTFIPKDTVLLGSWMCQGKMPLSVRQRYEVLQTKDPDDPRIAMLIDNFDRAQSHPDQADLEAAASFAEVICEDCLSQMG